MKRIYIGDIDNSKEFNNLIMNFGIESFHKEFPDLLSAVKPNDEIVICNMTDIKFSVRELIAELNCLKDKNIKINVINYFNIDLNTYLNILNETMKMQQSYLSQRTKEGIEKAKEIGHFSGRPKISQTKINEIQYWHEQNLPLRVISEKTNVSLGTVHKYVADLEKNEEIN